MKKTLRVDYFYLSTEFPCEKDWSCVKKWDQVYFSRPWPGENWDKLPFENTNYGLGLLFNTERPGESRLVGFLLFALFPLEEMAHLLKIWVSPDQRGKGRSEILFWQSVQKMAPRKVKIFFLEVEESNGRARGFYRRLGFIELQTIRNYYGSGENGVSAELVLKTDTVEKI